MSPVAQAEVKQLRQRLEAAGVPDDLEVVHCCAGCGTTDDPNLIVDVLRSIPGLLDAAERSMHLKEELDFLVAREVARRLRATPRCYGLSSDGLVAFALGGPEPVDRPADVSDLLACELTYAMAPAHLRPTMEPWLAKWRLEVYARYPEAQAGIAAALREAERAEHG